MVLAMYSETTGGRRDPHVQAHVGVAKMAHHGVEEVIQGMLDLVSSTRTAKDSSLRSERH